MLLDGSAGGTQDAKPAMQADLQIAFSLRDRRIRGEHFVGSTSDELDTMVRTPQASYHETCIDQMPSG
jgi:hypothetical protein